MSKLTVPDRKGKDFWGPPTWTSIHILSLSVQDQQTSQYFVKFLWTLTKILPCDVCRLNLEAKLKTVRPEDYMSNRQQAFLYTYTIHDMANQHINHIGKQPLKVSPNFDDILRVYITSLSVESTKFFGPPIWVSMHSLAAAYREENASYFRDYIYCVTMLIPDVQSRNHTLEFLNKYNINKYLRSNHDLFHYIFQLHDYINTKTNNKSPAYHDVKRFYFSAMGQECNDCKI